LRIHDGMTEFVAALPMYDWPEVRAETDAEWARMRDALRAEGVRAPDILTRRNADLPPVPGGIRDADGRIIAPDPATLPPDQLDMHTLWVHPQLLFAQTCWGPMELGVERHVRLIGQPSYDAFEGGDGELYSSAIVMRKSDRPAATQPILDGRPSIPLGLISGKRLAYNSLDSMSGIIALTRDLTAMGAGLDIFPERIETGSHRASVVAVAEDRADVCAIDCRSWAMVKRFKDVSGVEVVGWTGKRKGLPFITALGTPDDAAIKLTAVVGRARGIPPP
jgi:ABC-type phosphate/phosphonate transport system substrate-binding protein